MPEPTPPGAPRTDPSRVVVLGPLRHAPLSDAVRLTKVEAFDACQLLADADRCLVRAGHPIEAAALADLFELIESRLCEREPAPDTTPGTDGAGGSIGLASSDQDAEDSLSGSYPREREFTQ
jgi:hypothetical protein